MRFLEGVDLPEEVIEAHATGNLVFFVGAGASMSPPSCLPSFRDLARKLGESARIPFTEDFNDKIDTFIGSLPSGPVGFDAHRHAAALLQPEGSRPNDVHRALIRLAASGPIGRIVTTNFDDHLSAAAIEEGIDIGDCWIGPALPLGRAFRGIVHLHGSLKRDYNELVLDDRDFGRAYFGDGWAPRFLQPMFEHYVVLFVGYSLTDTVMRYLTLGLPSRSRRFVLVPESDARAEAWSRLGVTPIPYPNDDETHASLPRLLEEWDHWVRMRHTEHTERMERLISLWEPTAREGEDRALPAFSIVEEDYLKSQISTVDGARTFVSMASAPEWLEWLDRLPDFSALFAVGGDVTEVSEVLARWFASTFVAEPTKSAAAMEALRRHRQSLHTTLRRQIAFGVHELEERDGLAALRWRTILATSIHGHSAPSQLEDLLTFRSGTSPMAPSLARKALIPYLQLLPSFSFSIRANDEWPRVEIKWPLKHHVMSEHVGAWIAKQESHVALGVLEQALVHAYELLGAYYGEHPGGSLEWGRSAIEPHSQDQFSGPIDVIIDGLRDLGVVAAESTPELHDRWWSLGYGLFRRLALHLVAASTKLDSDQKLRWVISRGAIFELRTKHEAFQVLLTAAPTASPEVRQELLGAVLAGDPNERDGDGWSLTNEYETYNLLVWLTKADSSWEAAAEELSRIQAANADFAPREHPDFSMWHESGTWSGEPEVPIEDFRKKVAADPKEALLLLENAGKSERIGQDDFFRKDLSLARGMAEQAPKDGLALWQAAETSEVPEQRRSQIRLALLQGWTKADLGDSADHVLECVRELSSSEGTLYPVAEFLLEQTRKRVTGPDTEFLTQAREIANSIWDRHRGSFQPHVDADPSALALNTWPGDLVYFWLAQVQRRWREKEDSWNGLNGEELAALKSLLEGPPETLQAIWPAMASQLNFLHGADPDFAEKWLLPLFSRPESLRFTWGSFLYHPRCNQRLLEAGLLDAIVDNFARLSGLELDRLEGQFQSLAASVAVFAATSAESRVRLLDAAVIAEDGMYASGFASSVIDQLDNDTQVAEEAWASWLHQHIAQRLDGVPRDAAPEEIARWADVVPYLGHSVPEAVELFRGRGVGLGERYRSPEKLQGSITAHGTLLVEHLADRVRNTTQSGYMLDLEIRQLIDDLGAALGETAIEAIANAAREKGFIRE